MKNIFFLFAILFFVTTAEAQNVAINNTGAAPNAFCLLDVSSTTKGLLVPRMTTAQRTAISTPAKGLLVFDNKAYNFCNYHRTYFNK